MSPTLEPEQQGLTLDEAAWKAIGVLDTLAPIDETDNSSLQLALSALEGHGSGGPPINPASAFNHDIWASALQEADNARAARPGVDNARIEDAALAEVLRQQEEEDEFGSQDSAALNNLLASLEEAQEQDIGDVQRESGLPMRSGRRPPMLGDVGRESSLSAIVNEILSDPPIPQHSRPNQPPPQPSSRADESQRPEQPPDAPAVTPSLTPSHMEIQFDLTKFLEEDVDDQEDPQLAAIIDQLEQGLGI
mmetsp:Transcript_35062/g.81852  ORF Transcript_35062/g.81852 Transcript_35062/m.81852 type:complete len:249 (-) Transcript_35062:59-805(-)